MSGANGSGVGGTSRRWRVLGVTALAAFMAFLDATIVNIAFPDIQRSFSDVDRATLSWVLNAYNIAFAALLVPAGRLADRVGRKRLFLIGLVVFTVASALCGAAPSAPALIAFRVVQAAGAAAIIPTCIALVLPEFSLERRATAIALLGAAAAVAAAGGPSLGGLITDSADWRWIFLVNLPFGLAAFVAGRRVLVEARDERRAAALDVVGIVLLILTVGLLAFGLVQSSDWGWGDARVIGALAAAAVLLPVLVMRTRRSAAPVVEPALLRIRSFTMANASTLAFAAAFYAKIFCDVLFLSSVWGYSALTSGLAITPGPLITAAVAGPAGRLADRFGPRAIAAPGCVIYAAGCAWYAVRAGAHPSYVAEWLPGAALTGIGCGMALPVLTSAAVSDLPAPRFATGSAVNSMTRQLGAVLGIAILVAIVGTPTAAGALDAFDAGWAYTAAAGLVAAALAVGIGRAGAARRTQVGAATSAGAAAVAPRARPPSVAEV
jgi:EmrB/QacA subfamily drug resistance transporter